MSNVTKKITFYIPGMFTYFGEKGSYPSVSITGEKCELQCNHCKGTLLESMISATTPKELIQVGEKLSQTGAQGMLLTGGCSYQGKLPWKDFIPAIYYCKNHLQLLISAHTGLLDRETAEGLAGSRIDQALIDIIGDDETWREVYHIDHGVKKLEETLSLLKESRIPLVPHIVVGINFGKISGEYKALELLQDIPLDALVFVSLMPLSRTPMKKCIPPRAEDIASLITKAKEMYPNTVLSLGCARERGNHQIDLLALESGVDRIAIPSEETVRRAEELGMKIIWERTCCSVPSKQ
jgi:uncharacterized radical SAM superfamily protein